MNTLVSLLALAIVLLAKASQVNMMPVQSVDSSNATNISTITTLNRSVNAILHQLVGATQGIQFLLTQNVGISHISTYMYDMYIYHIYIYMHTYVHT